MNFILGMVVGAMFTIAISWMGYSARMEALRQATEEHERATKDARGAEQVWNNMILGR